MGAGWTFVIWGRLHGIYLFVSHTWRGVRQSLGWNFQGRFYLHASRLLTFFAVVVAWVVCALQEYLKRMGVLSPPP